MDLINQIERDNPVEEWVVNGLHIWPILRMRIAFNLYATNHNSSSDSADLKTKITSSYLSELAKYPIMGLRMIGGLVRTDIAIMVDRVNNSSVTADADIVFLLNTTGRTQLGNRWFSRVCSPLVSLARKHQKNSLLLERAAKYEYRYPRSEATKYIQTSIDIMKIKSYLKSGYSNTSFCIECKADVQDMLKSYNLTPSIYNLHQERRLHVYIKNLSEYYLRIFEKVNPEAGLMVCYYSIECMAFIIACKKYGIPSVDLQHGVQGAYHPAYGNWLKVPDKGYEVLPDYFWCWSNHEVNCIKKWQDGMDVHFPLLGGNLWLEWWKDGGDSLTCFYDDELGLLSKGIRNQINILVTLQPGLELPDWFKGVVTDSPQNWFWWIRLHPGMISERNYYISVFNELSSNTNIDYATDVPLLALLKYMDIHVTSFSSCVIEAEQFNVPSILIDENGGHYYREQIEAGVAVVAYSQADFENVVRSTLICPRNKINMGNTSILQNADNALNTILQKRIK